MEPSIDDFKRELAEYNRKHYEPIGAILDRAATASIEFFSDGSCGFKDKKGVEIKNCNSLDELFERLQEQNRK
ncbi:MAG: hypothetical protein AB7Q37_07200 [Pyrinomonadaceae bacterium]